MRRSSGARHDARAGVITVQTDTLISALAADLTVKWPLRRVFVIAALAGSAVAAVVFALSLGLRPDLVHAAETVRFVFKFVVTLSLAAAALGVVWRSAQPGAPLGPWLPWLLLSPALLTIACVGELLALPPSDWAGRLMGHNALLCLAAIPLLAMGPLAGLMAALRYGLAVRPGLAGAMAGLAASGIGATFYASHCPDDSPLFVATWYVIATGLVTGIGILSGRVLLRS